MKLFVITAGITFISFPLMLFYDLKAGLELGKNTTTPTAVPATPTPEVFIKPSPDGMIIPQQLHVFQTFNNCGPANLSMLLSYNGFTVSQEDVGLKLRPYQNPQGDNDDKSVTVAELAEEAKNYNLISYYRPNGDIDLLKKFIANGLPVLVRTWLHPGEDIGHYRIVRGYDDTTGEIIQDDSYEGNNLRYPYAVFNEMWQPFNYEYLVLARPEKKDILEAIIGEETDERTAWSHAYNRALEEVKNNPESPYPFFNQSVALYHLGNYEESVNKFERVQMRLPPRMLWYQIQPIKSYLELKRYDSVFALTDTILNNNNRGFSELYVLRGRAYTEQGNTEAARYELQQAVFYNQNSREAQKALSEI